MTDLLAASLQQAPTGVSSLNYPVPNLLQSGMYSGAPSSSQTSTASRQDTGPSGKSTKLHPFAYLPPPPPSYPLHPIRTPTTRDSISSMSLPLSPFPTPPATPASSYISNCTNFPFPPATSYNTTLVPLPQPPQNYMLPITLQYAPVLDQTPPPTPSPPPPLTQIREVSAATQHTCTDIVSMSIFLSALDKMWPESQRRSSSIMRTSLYDKVVSNLQGGGLELRGRQKQWIKKSEFFLVEKDGRGLLLAVPALKSRVTRRGGGGGGGKCESRRTSSYRLVARLQDFYYIISSYHNNTVGHHGIRKTFAMIQEEYSYLPRTAVAKYIELCNICRVHRTGKPETSGRKSKTVSNNNHDDDDDGVRPESTVSI